MKPPLHTGLYTSSSLKLMPKLREALIKMWPTNHMVSASMRLKNGATLEPDGQVVLKHVGGFETSLWNKTNDEILKWLAIHVKLSIKDLYDWNHPDDTVVKVLSDDNLKVTVSDIHMIYDFWMHRKNFKRRYSNGQIIKWIGEPRDPITTEIEASRIEQINKIKEEHDKLINESYKTLNSSIEDFRKKASAEHLARIDKLNAERDQKIMEVNKSFDSMLSVTNNQENPIISEGQTKL